MVLPIVHTVIINYIKSFQKNLDQKFPLKFRKFSTPEIFHDISLVPRETSNRDLIKPAVCGLTRASSTLL